MLGHVWVEWSNFFLRLLLSCWIWFYKDYVLSLYDAGSLFNECSTLKKESCVPLYELRHSLEILMECWASMLCLHMLNFAESCVSLWVVTLTSDLLGASLWRDELWWVFSELYYVHPICWELLCCAGYAWWSSLEEAFLTAMGDVAFVKVVSVEFRCCDLIWWYGLGVLRLLLIRVLGLWGLGFGLLRISRLLVLFFVTRFSWSLPLAGLYRCARSLR